MRSLRIVTLNTWKNEGDYAARLRAMASGLKALAPDVVLLQEVFCTLGGAADTAHLLASSLRMALVYAPARRKNRHWLGSDVPSESGLAILVRGRAGWHERLELPSDERGGERIALLADLVVDDEMLLVGCVHLSHLRGDEARRREQLEKILAHPRWSDPKRVRLLGGDFNAPSAAPEISWLGTHPKLQVADVFGANGVKRVTHPQPPRTERTGRCIDFLFLVAPSGEKLPTVAGSSLVLDAPVEGVWPSDHAGVMADLTLL